MAANTSTKKDAKPATTSTTEIAVATEQATSEATSEATKQANWQGQWLISNNTPSIAAFPELGEQPAATIAPYTPNVPVTFKSALMFESFTHNVQQLRELCRWDDVRGVLLHSQTNETEAHQATEIKPINDGDSEVA